MPEPSSASVPTRRDAHAAPCGGSNIDKVGTEAEKSLSFSIIEMLVVLAVIVVLVGVAGMSLRGQATGWRLESGHRLVGSLLRSARAQAILRQAPARLILQTDPSAPDRFLKSLGIVYESPRGSGYWRSSHPTTRLPHGVLFDRNLSAASGLRTMELDYPGAREEEEGQGQMWTYCEYASTGETTHPGSLLIIGEGIIHALQPNPEGVRWREDARAGFLLRRLGGIVSLTSLEDIKPLLSIGE